MYLAILLVTWQLGLLSDPLNGVFCDLQIGDQKGHFESPGNRIFKNWNHPFPVFKALLTRRWTGPL